MIGDKRDFSRGDYFFAREQSREMRAATWSRPSLWQRIKEWLT